ncbi:hypothetical protein D9V29_03500 [Mycetocola manganoxydans]|uniref:Acyl-CoA synthetase n=2 Tax=Mycetocola manganoxydans TaxID=699879 RepID=A0A3L6ZZD5_9MICO|nr:hypothetical protein D9V29_03500 [Mycetocola manganoxydans]
MPGGIAQSRSRYWLVAVARALVAAVAGLVITFSPDHSASLGLSVFGGFAVLTALVHLAGSRTLDADTVTRRSFVAQGILSLAAGVLALILAPIGGQPAFFAIVLLWALLTGALELYSGFHLRGRSALARDWMTIGGVTVLLAVAFLLVPQGLDQHFTGPDGVERSLTASIVSVGTFGAYAAIVAVLLAIGGFSLKWGTDSSGRVAPETESQL